MKTIITTDSGMDPIDIDYMVSGMLIRNDDKEFRDVREITSQEVLEQTKSGYLFKTSAPTLSDYYEVFTNALNEGDNVIHISMGSGISSASITSSNIVAKDIDEERITVLDSKNGATGGTLINLYAKHLSQKGLSKREILEQLQKLISRIKTAFFVPNPTGFQRSGRNNSELCLKDKALLIGEKVLSVAGMKFRVDFNEEGNLYVKKMLAGKSEVKGMQMIREIVNDDTIKNYEQEVAVIGTVLENKVNMQEIKKYLSKYFHNVIRKDINAVVAAYGSPDLVGLSLVRKQK